ncbi:MAG: fibronectin type III domain-containing protein [Longimicrobiales bacterium]
MLRPAAEGGPAWNLATSYPDRIVLTWSGDPTTTQSVTWRTDTTVAVGVVQYAIASPGPGFGVLAVTDTATTERVDARAIEDAGVVVNFHSVVLSGLVPDTLYAYRVGDGTDWTEWFHFQASREPKPFSFIYFGDAQNDILSLWSRTIRSSFAEAPDARFMIHAGDLIDNAHNDLQWGEWFRAGGWIHAMMPSIPAAGNHEYDPFNAEDEAKDIDHLSVFWRPQFTLPLNGVKGQEESNYYIDYQGTRILVLNSNEQREDQAAWLEKVLADNPQPWTIATFHHPTFSTGQERDNPVLRGLWKPLFDRYGVDLWCFRATITPTGVAEPSPPHRIRSPASTPVTTRPAPSSWSPSAAARCTISRRASGVPTRPSSKGRRNTRSCSRSSASSATRSATRHIRRSAACTMRST